MLRPCCKSRTAVSAPAPVPYTTKLNLNLISHEQQVIFVLTAFLNDGPPLATPSVTETK